MNFMKRQSAKSTSTSNLAMAAISFYLPHLYFICVMPSFCVTVIFCNGMLSRIVVECPYMEGVPIIGVFPKPTVNLKVYT